MNGLKIDSNNNFKTKIAITAIKIYLIKLGNSVK